MSLKSILFIFLIVVNTAFAQDLDQDGVDSSIDCNDYDANISSQHIYYEDLDGDGVGDINSQILVCNLTPPQGYAYWGADVAFATQEGRTIGLEMYSTSEAESFQNNIDLAKQVGVQTTSLGLGWSTFEVAPGVYQDSDIQSIADLNNAFSQNQVDLSLTMWVVNGSDLSIPQYIKDAGLRMNDPQVIQAFKNFLDWTFDQLQSTSVISLQIGNEIDHFYNQHLNPGCNGENPNLAYPGDYQFYIEYFEFLSAIKQYVAVEKNYYGKGQFPIGVTATLQGLTSSPTKEIMLAGNQISDVVNVTYYPLGTNFAMQEHFQVYYDLTSLVNTYPDKPIFIQEIGYSSGVINLSSETKQRQFVSAFFWTWDLYKDKIPYAQFLMMTDWSKETLDYIIDLPAYSCLDSPTFRGYLGNLGLRDRTGRFKPAFYSFYSELLRRGFID